MTPAPGELIKAVKACEVGRATALLEQGADPDERDDNDNTPLICAASRTLELVKLLIDKGADLDAKNKHGMTALMCSALIDETDILELLIERGACLEEKTHSGMTALDWAEETGTKEALKILKAAPEQQRHLIEVEAERKRIADLHDTAATRQDALKKRNPKFNLNFS